MSIDAMKQALEALKYYAKSIPLYSPGTDAITALRAAIEAAEKVEPVAWQTWINGEPANTFHYKQDAELHFNKMQWKYPDDSRKLLPLYTTPQPAIPEGWQLVPVEPTEAMLDAGEMIDGDGVTYVDLFKAMLAAAPKPENSHE